MCFFVLLSPPGVAKVKSRVRGSLIVNGSHDLVLAPTDGRAVVIPDSLDLPVPTDEHVFMAELEVCWDDQRLTKMQRRMPVMGKKPLRLLDLYQEVITRGGYLQLCCQKGGWAAIHRALPNYSATETSGSFRLKVIP